MQLSCCCCVRRVCLVVENAALEVDKNTALLTKDRKREGQGERKRKRERLMLMVSANLQLAAVVSRALISL